MISTAAATPPSRVFLPAFALLAAVFCGLVLPLATLLAADSLFMRLLPGEIATVYLWATALWVLTALILAALAAGIARMVAAPRLILTLASAFALSAALVTLIHGSRMWIQHQTQEVHGNAMWGTIAALAVTGVFISGAFTPWGRRQLYGIIPHVQRTLRGPAILFAVLAIGFAIFGERETAHAVQSPRDAHTTSVAPARRPDIFLITVDTLTTHDMGLHGYSRDTTPNFARHAKRFATFDRFYSNCNFTTCSVASVFSGLRPWTHRVQHLQGFFRDRERGNNLAALLDAAGYRTAAFVANPYAQPRHLGMANSFERTPPDYLGYVRTRLHDRLSNLGGTRASDLLYMFPFKAALNLTDKLLLEHLTGWNPQGPERQIRDALQLVDRAPNDERPLFLWLHVYPPHHPYLPPEPFLFRFNRSDVADTAAEQRFDQGFFPAEMQSYITNLRARYDENIAYTDAAVGKFLDGLVTRGRFDDAVVVVTADHGESFERSYIGHAGPLLHEPLIHIPFMIHAPGYAVGGHVQQIAEQVDIMPSLLELAAIPAPSYLEGRSLTGPLRGAPHADGAAFAMTLEENTAFGKVTRGTIAMLDGSYKYVRYLGDPQRADELYDLAADPRESRNLARTDVRRATAMRERIESQLKRAAVVGSSSG